MVLDGPIEVLTNMCLCSLQSIGDPIVLMTHVDNVKRVREDKGA